MSPLAAERVSGLYDIDIECSFVHPSTLRLYMERGWAWRANLKMTRTAHNLTMIQRHQTMLGRLNVTLGCAYNPNTDTPIYTDDLIGLWIRSVV